MENKLKEISLNEYVDSWTSHINTLDRLRWNLSYENQNKLDKIQEELKSLVVEAVKDLQRRREEKEIMQKIGVDEDDN